MQTERHASVSFRLMQSLRMDIVSGKYPPATQFPTVRALAFDHAVNPNTMQKVLSMLEEEGLLVSFGARGRFVTEDTAVIEATFLRLKQAFLEQMLEKAAQMGIEKCEIIRFLEENTLGESERKERDERHNTGM